MFYSSCTNNTSTSQNAYVSFSPFCRSFMRALLSIFLHKTYTSYGTHTDNINHTVKYNIILLIHIQTLGCITCSLHVCISPPTLKKVLVSDNICD